MGAPEIDTGCDFPHNDPAPGFPLRKGSPGPSPHARASAWEALADSGTGS
ncbi:hypothetical protein ASNO1_48550 [Corallococcus caeni]|uniref:Uncharacterized protein n=1 Tax=Corallococcus caeni TaxID=3082388 RepID=A0ABQ6QXQ3_9BACT|nr:hypothetical protein ASNO1_48550 [Corallococcus sp. NO1]